LLDIRCFNITFFTSQLGNVKSQVNNLYQTGRLVRNTEKKIIHSIKTRNRFALCISILEKWSINCNHVLNFICSLLINSSCIYPMLKLTRVRLVSLVTELYTK
jgi:hypothetical protein